MQEECAIVVIDDLQQQTCTRKCTIVNRHLQQQTCTFKKNAQLSVVTSNNKDVQENAQFDSLMATTNNKHVQQNSPLSTTLTSNNKHVEENSQSLL